MLADTCVLGNRSLNSFADARRAPVGWAGAVVVVRDARGCLFQTSGSACSQRVRVRVSSGGFFLPVRLVSPSVVAQRQLGS